MIRKVQVVVYCRNPEMKVLLLRRGPRRGDIWQPVTGKVEAEDPTLEAAAHREVEEETGIDRFERTLDGGTAFDFRKNEREFREHLFGIEVARPVEVRLSREHVAYEWVDTATAAERMSWDINREGLKRIVEQAGAAG